MISLSEWVALIGLIVSIILAAIIGLILRVEHRLTELEALSRRTHEQVANTHETNLREDIDRLEAKIDSIGRNKDNAHLEIWRAIGQGLQDG